MRYEQEWKNDHRVLSTKRVNKDARTMERRKGASHTIFDPRRSAGRLTDIGKFFLNPL
jgi:hypothetical protein